MKMKSQIFLSVLVLQSIFLTVVAAKQKDKPFFLFRCDDGDDDEDGKGKGRISSGDGDGDGDGYSVKDGYMPYPTRRKRALNSVVGNTAGSKARRRMGKDEADVTADTDTDTGYLFPKCSKSKGSKTAVSKSSKSTDTSDMWTGSSSKSGKTSKSGGKSWSSSSDDHESSPSTQWSSSPNKSPIDPTDGYKPYEGTARPTPKPTRKPEPIKTPQQDNTYMPTEISSCDALSNGDVVRTSKSATVKYSYEAEISNYAEIEWVKDDMEKMVARYVGEDLMGCDDRRRRLLQDSLVGRRLGGLEVVGVDAVKPKDEVDEDKSCKYLTGENCHVVNAGMTLYLSESRRRKLSEDEELEESSEDALKVIMGGLNEGAFTIATDGLYEVYGLIAARYISGTTNDGEVIVDNGSGRGGANGAKDGGGEDTIESSKAAAIGGSLLGVGLVALVALALVVVVRNKLRSGERYNEFDNDEDAHPDDLDGKETDTDTSSLKSTPSTLNNSKQRAYVVGEEGSVYTNATHDTRYLYNASYEAGNGNDDDQQVDVHRCTSAMCPICNGKETVFVNAVEDEASVELEGYEFSHDPNSTSMKRSFEYEPKEDVSSPSFDNPAEMTERPYVVDNTIDF
mmetsp:Transcript_24/g.31  ORF Transcript_24/g.31 Transcript_24/m.31 type:complete len:622 (+) Transcript_24:159-2024(+)|eukprot:CAMPEP_0172307618 /NCGR_PEP_ID=MMETSP1058-20130122/8435_1 /TAXON_ID=83371 /ORGANISM="Detonula confervacea, Strain CCMP 353" /LENGTH=621 /DNA_ID=CAMNT_0013019833 /DNA_START=118 /DNA_END=1983 /DNA_ORIENTATION=+